MDSVQIIHKNKWLKEFYDYHTKKEDAWQILYSAEEVEHDYGQLVEP